MNCLLKSFLRLKLCLSFKNWRHSILFSYKISRKDSLMFPWFLTYSLPEFSLKCLLSTGCSLVKNMLFSFFASHLNTPCPPPIVQISTEEKHWYVLWEIYVTMHPLWNSGHDMVTFNKHIYFVRLLKTFHKSHWVRSTII